ncbi:hypothetical protein Tco_1398918, partial [Tanacetum coccineum]
IDDVQVLDNVVCVDRTKFLIEFKDVYGSEAKTSAAVDSVVVKEAGSHNVDVNTNKAVADEDIDLAGNNVCVSDKKSFLGDEDVDYCDKNDVISEQKMFIGHEDFSDAKRDESGDADINSLSDTTKFASDADANSVSDRKKFERWNSKVKSSVIMHDLMSRGSMQTSFILSIRNSNILKAFNVNKWVVSNFEPEPIILHLASHQHDDICAYICF